MENETSPSNLVEVVSVRGSFVNARFEQCFAAHVLGAVQTFPKDGTGAINAEIFSK